MKIHKGDKYGRWTVLEVGVKNPESKAKNPPNMALCECECGTKRYKEYRDLYTGRSQSCGCWKGEQLAQKNAEKSSVKIGNIYGFLTVIEDLGMRKQASRDKNEKWFKCRCENCGNENFEVSGNNLQSGQTKSCGCVSSLGEKRIGQFLRNNKINYATQYTFKDLLSKKGYNLKFDFAIFNKDNVLSMLIEFDGRQHTQGPDGTWKNSSSLEEIQYNDNLKNEYCKNNNLKLIRISYLDMDKIEEILKNLLNDFIEL